MTAPADEVKERDICVGMTDDELADLGLDYIAKGWPVLVIKFAKLATKIEKTPTTPHGHHDATLNCSVLIEQIDAARRRLNGTPLGIGAVPGPAGHVTVDYDTKNGARGGEQLERHRATYGDVVDRVSYTSISGAINVILRKPHTSTAIANTSPWPDVDVRADSGWIVPPGNWCPWGSWDWRSGDLDDLDDAVMPVEMFEELKAAGDTESEPATSAEVEEWLDAGKGPHDEFTEHELKKWVETIGTCANRNPTLFEALSWLRRLRPDEVNRRDAFDAIDAAWKTRMTKDGETRRMNEPLDVLGRVVGYDKAVAEQNPVDQSKPEVIVSGRHLDEIANELVGVLVAQNEPPVLFAHAEVVSLLDGRTLHPLDHEALLDLLEQRTRPIKIDKEGERSPGRFPVDLRKVVLRRLLGRLPRLEALATAPFLRDDGSICTTPGYDADTEMYLLDGLEVVVPDEPTDDQLADAVALIDELIADFPLPTDTARAHVLALALTPAVRHLVPLAPMFVMSGNNAGVGKGKLADGVLGIHHGYGHDERVPTDPMPADDEELRKAITAVLAEGRRAIVYDEAYMLIGRSLARLLTSVVWSDRYLGTNTTIQATNRLTCVALGNQVEIVGDLRRRVVRIDLHSPLSDPSLRNDFRHPDLLAWAAEHRAELLSAVLTILRAWHVRGRPGITKKLGSFEAWADMVGGALAVAGVTGFLDNVAEVMHEADHLDEEMNEHVADLADRFGQHTEFTIKDVIGRAEFGWFDLPSGIRYTDPSANEQLGKLYRRFQGRVWPCGWSITKRGATDKRTRWAVNPGEGGTRGDKGGSPDVASRISDAPDSSKENLTQSMRRHDDPPLSPLIPPSDAPCDDTDLDALVDSALSEALGGLTTCPTCQREIFDPTAGECLRCPSPQPHSTTPQPETRTT